MKLYLITLIIFGALAAYYGIEAIETLKLSMVMK